MIIVIRISGLVEIPPNVQETLFRMRLRRKYSAVLLKHGPENLKLLKKVRNFVAYGRIDKETLYDLLAKRAKSIGKTKIDPEKIIAQLDKKSLSDLGVKGFFRLHPPRGGINTKVHFPINKGVLGDNGEKINDLVRRML
jgi:large subunit ribosomal protein L30